VLAAMRAELLVLRKVLPAVSINTVVNLRNSTTTGVPGTMVSAPSGMQIAPVLAFGILGLYLLGFPGHPRDPHPPPQHQLIRQSTTRCHC
jgi:hypothetical protein